MKQTKQSDARRVERGGMIIVEGVLILMMIGETWYYKHPHKKYQ